MTTNAKAPSRLHHTAYVSTNLERTRAFYEQLGFRWAWGPAGPDPVAAMTHPSGLELNFILNAPDAVRPNVLMDGGVRCAADVLKAVWDQIWAFPR